MGATAAAFSAWFSGTAATAAGAGAAGTAAVGAGAAGTAAAGGLGTAIATGAGAAGASAVLGKLMEPDAPEVKGPVAMPDPLEQQKARERSIIEQMARRGRGASILTSPGGSQTLGS
jgi:hypothetical protein